VWWTTVGAAARLTRAKRPVLCRDLTDSFHRDPRGHFRGTDRVVAHVQRWWCPTVTSELLVGGAPFRVAEHEGGARSCARTPRQESHA